MGESRGDVAEVAEGDGREVGGRVDAAEGLGDGFGVEPGAPWGEYGTSGLTARALQLLLKDFGISSSNRRFRDGSQRRGFARNQFADAWTRYCPQPEQPAASGG
ncbi:DUF3631 domain-containing protein [Actinacidiphila yeochonensis]|uniref:DUF3631 domain-containing protein n=1 Tax=Actinacidiphila yeochonensis TaxID=89050 RepID=UPI0038994360